MIRSEQSVEVMLDFTFFQILSGISNKCFTLLLGLEAIVKCKLTRDDIESRILVQSWLPLCRLGSGQVGHVEIGSEESRVTL